MSISADRAAMHLLSRRRLIALSSAAAAVGLVGPPNDPPAHTSNNVSVTLQPTTTALPVVVADKKGMFAKNNVSVKWTISQLPISDSIATLGRQSDVVMGTQPALIAAAGQGVPVVVITGGALDTVKAPKTKIVASPESGIKSYKDLAGKTVGALTLTGNIHYALLNILQKEGVDFNKIRWVVNSAPQLPDLLKGGRVQAIETIEPFASAAIAAGGVDLGDPFRAISDNAFIGIWLSNRDWANKNKDLVLRFNKSLEEAAKWIAENPAESKEIISSYTGLKGIALEKTPIPEFEFQTTAEALNKAMRPDLNIWVDILKRTSDFPAVKVETLLPSWAQ